MFYDLLCFQLLPNEFPQGRMQLYLGKEIINSEINDFMVDYLRGDLWHLLDVCLYLAWWTISVEIFDILMFVCIHRMWWTISVEIFDISLMCVFILSMMDHFCRDLWHLDVCILSMMDHICMVDHFCRDLWHLDVCLYLAWWTTSVENFDTSLICVSIHSMWWTTSAEIFDISISFMTLESFVFFTWETSFMC